MFFAALLHSMPFFIWELFIRDLSSTLGPPWIRLSFLKAGIIAFFSYTNSFLSNLLNNFWVLSGRLFWLFLQWLSIQAPFLSLSARSWLPPGFGVIFLLDSFVTPFFSHPFSRMGSCHERALLLLDPVRYRYASTWKFYSASLASGINAQEYCFFYPVTLSFFKLVFLHAHLCCRLLFNIFSQ